MKSLLLEIETIHRGLHQITIRKILPEFWKSFAKLMRKGNIIGALKLLTNNMTYGIRLLNEKTLNSLTQKHPQSQPAYEETFINSELPVIDRVIFDDINE